MPKSKRTIPSDIKLSVDLQSTLRWLQEMSGNNKQAAAAFKAFRSLTSKSIEITVRVVNKDEPPDEH